jgi:hypothetical protein
MKKEKELDKEDSKDAAKKKGIGRLPTYNCGGAIHIKFSLKREAVNVVYKHNPIHSSRANEQRYVVSRTLLRTLLAPSPVTTVLPNQTLKLLQSAATGCR